MSSLVLFIKYFKKQDKVVQSHEKASGVKDHERIRILFQKYRDPSLTLSWMGGEGLIVPTLLKISSSSVSFDFCDSKTC